MAGSGAQNDAYLSVVIQSDGKIVVTGYEYNGTDTDMVVARYNTNGTLDTTFGGTGKSVENSGAADAGFGVSIEA